MEFVAFVIKLLLALVALAFYFLPTAIACLRGHRNALAIGMTNLFFGVTVIGWMVALIWSIANPAAVIVVDSQAAAAAMAHDQPARRSGAARKIGKFFLVAIGALIVLTALFVMLASLTGGKVSVDVSKTSATVSERPVPRAGVPVPADQLLGE